MSVLAVDKLARGDLAGGTVVSVAQAAWEADAQARPSTPGAMIDTRPFAGKIELAVDALVEQVVDRNPTLSQMIAAWQAATARSPQVTSLDDPMFDTKVAPASFGSNKVEPAYMVGVSQKLPYPGKLALRGEAAEAEASAAGLDVEDIRLQLTESARDAFYEYYLAYRALEVNQENLDLLKRFRENAKTRYENNLVSQQDYLQADVEIGRETERRLGLVEMRQIAMARMNTLMHLPADSPLPPPPREIKPGDQLPKPRTLLIAALRRRPDLQALADRIRADDAKLGLANREYYPDFEVVAAYDTIMGNGPARDLAPQVGVRLNLPVRLARRDAAVAEAEARLVGRQAELARRIDQVSFQVQAAYERVDKSEQAVHVYERTILPAAKLNVEAAQAAYTAGKIPFLSLIDAQRNMVMVRDRYYEAVADYFRRRATLERVIGGPVEAPDLEPHR